jgi:hypothetical protein
MQLATYPQVDELVDQTLSDNSTNPALPTSQNLLKRGGDEGSGPLAKRSRLNSAQQSNASRDLAQPAFDAVIDGDTNRTWGLDVQQGAVQDLSDDNSVPATWNEDALQLFDGDTNRFWGFDVQQGVAPNLFDGDNAL